MSKDACENAEKPAAKCHIVCHSAHDNCLVLLLTLHCRGHDRSRLLLYLPKCAPCHAWWLLKGLPAELCWPRRPGRRKEGFHRVGLHCMHLQVQSFLPDVILPYILQPAPCHCRSMRLPSMGRA